ncbi:FG-nucleoporin NUP1 NDAI_0B04150 [Naumovozyma dairenensis CBS 421]|uniref:Uncharacterized protein n=1 Tax=Naumovozyma dairenensis (strain ATCC 10597 / BCRC 20456 / CBS 421 / NBRC 0211 / NRRL Y-12639) TaxID=1071378 RepID=G0W6N8_NAUDC|nr:hypothetical protein NDAI_0B04150 [Naumovozyma dairenensis CBS 421]CCD23449.1 hypothetical protein NDAI_0B04150 [Naumovozyma dairenensis CBS 421]
MSSSSIHSSSKKISDIQEKDTWHLNDKNGQDSVILYQSDSSSNTRPPILPILPIQRLRLLRQKQQWRIGKESQLLRLLPSISSNSRSTSISTSRSRSRSRSISRPQSTNIPENGSANDTVLYHKSQTPSPIKKLPSNIKFANPNPNRNDNGNDNDDTKHALTLELKSLNNINPILNNSHNNTSKKKKFKGTTWSGDFEYDLNDFSTTSDIVSQDKPSPSRDTKMTQDLSENIILRGSDRKNDKRTFTNNINKDVNVNSITDIQKDVLLNGPRKIKEKETTSELPLQQKKKETIEEPQLQHNEQQILSNKSQEKAKIILPTSGFDFLKDSNTPSKKVSFDLKPSIATTTTTTSTTSEPKIPVATKPFSFKSPSITDAPSTKPSLSFNFNKSTKPPKLEPIKSSDDRTSINLPFKLNQKDTAQKAFTFGATKTNIHEDENADENENEPKRKKRPVPDVVIDMTKDTSEKNSTPIFSFGTSKSATTAKEDQQKKPTFNFGTKPPIDNDPKAAVTTSEQSKPSFSFGATKSPDAAKPSFTFSSLPTNDTSPSVKPAFSFGSTAAKKDTTTDSTSAAANAPSFSFGSTPANKHSATTIEKPFFSFKSTTTTAAQTEHTENKEDQTISKEKDASLNVPFKFGTTSTAPESKEATTAATAKPTFSFGVSKPTETLANKPEAIPSISEGPPSKKLTFSFNKPAAHNASEGTGSSVAKPTFSFGKQSTTEGAKPSFSFSKPTEANTVPPSAATTGTTGFSFNKTTNPLLDANKATTTTVTPTTGLFSSKSNTNPLISTTTTSKPSFSFKNPSLAGKSSTASPNLSPSPGFAFGKPAEEAQQPTKPSFSFGATASTTNNDAKKLGISLTNPTASATGSQTSLFGQTSAPPSTAGSTFTFTNKPSTSPVGAFGSNNPLQTTASGTSLFGNTNPLISTNQQPSGSLFGNKPPVFGGVTANQQPPSSSVFGNTNPLQNPTTGAKIPPSSASASSSGMFGNMQPSGFSMNQNAGFGTRPNMMGSSVFNSNLSQQNPFGGNAANQLTNQPQSQSTFNPSTTANLHFVAGNTTALPSSIFNSGAPNTQSSAPFPQRKLARMRQRR